LGVCAPWPQHRTAAEAKSAIHDCLDVVVVVKVLIATFRASVEGLSIFLVTLFTCVMFYSSAIYYAELRHLTRSTLYHRIHHWVHHSSVPGRNFMAGKSVSDITWFVLTGTYHHSIDQLLYEEWRPLLLTFLYTQTVQPSTCAPTVTLPCCYEITLQ